MTAFLDIFNHVQKGNHGLTEEVVYKSIQCGSPFIPLWGGNKEHNTIDRMVSVHGKTKEGKPITVFNGEGIVISLDGSAGCMTYKSKQEFALNHHAGFFKVKDTAKKKNIPQFFALFYQNQLINSSISEGSKTLTLGQLYSMSFELPAFDLQEKIMTRIRPLLNQKSKIEALLLSIQKVKVRMLSHEYEKYQVREIPINKIVEYLSGNSGLTSKFVYQNLQRNGKKYLIQSGSTSEGTSMGMIPKCEIDGKSLNTFEDKEGLLVVRKGKAGSTKSLGKGCYAVTDDAYILYVKEECNFVLSLEWLGIYYKPSFLEYASSSDNGTWNMTGFFQNVVIDIPSIQEQKEIVALYKKLDNYETKLQSALAAIEGLFTKI